MKRWGVIAFVAAWLGVSAYTTVSLCLSLQHGIASVVIGALWTISKVFLGEYGRRLWRRPTFSVGTLFVSAIVVALVLGDVAGTLAYFEGTDHLLEMKGRSVSLKEATYQIAITEINREIESTQTRVDSYNALGSKFNTRAANQERKLATLRRERDDTLEKLSALPASAVASPTTVFDMFGVARRVVFLIIAFVIEACPAVGIAMLQNMKNESPVRTPYLPKPPPVRRKSEFDELVSTAESHIRSGMRPSYAKIRERLGVGQDVAVSIMEALRQQGTIRKRGNAHEVAA